MEVFLRKPSIGVAHPFLVQLVPFEAPLTGPFSAPTDTKTEAEVDTIGSSRQNSHKLALSPRENSFRRTWRPA